MENQIKYVRVFAQNQEVCTAFRALMTSYMEELDAHSDNPLPMNLLPKWIDSIIAMQGPSDRHTELCYVGGNLIGFLYGKVDHEDHKGFIKPGYGYIMEFYVRPQYRRKGYGKKMFLHMEHLFRKDGAKRMYLTADPVSGKPFWEATGFANTGEQSPENKLDIYEKDVFYKDAPFMILDEPTAALDPIAEAEVYERFNDIASDKTSVFISHRLSSCKFCDEIAVFHKGRLVQLGSHDKLVAEKNGKYHELWNAQAQYYTEKTA